MGIPIQDVDAPSMSGIPPYPLPGQGSRRATVAPAAPGPGPQREEPAPSRGRASAPGGPARRIRPAFAGAPCGSPGRGEGDRSLSRRGFLGFGLVALAGATAWVAPDAWASPPAELWGLDPEWGAEGCSCGGCGACRSHAANKLFASAAAANAGRAHVYCRCLVVPLGTIDRDVYDQLFLAGGGRPSVDRREQWVRSVLARASHVPAPPPGPAPPPVNSGDEDPPVDPGGPGCPAEHGSAAADGVVRASFRARVRRRSRGRRVVTVEVKAFHEVDASVFLVRGGRTIAKRAVASIAGRRTIVLSVPRSVSPGRARLRVEFRDRAGDRKVAARALRIPSRLRART